MMGKHHLAIGIATGLAASGGNPLAVVLCAVGSLLPDVDEPKSMLGRVMRQIPGVSGLQDKVEHRTWTHSLIALGLVSIIGIFWHAWLWVSLGYFLHLVADSLSRAGVAWFYPAQTYIRYDDGAFVLKNHNFWLYKTGDAAEAVICWVWVALCVASFVGGFFV